MQWTGSLLQKRGFDEIRNASQYYHALRQRFEHQSDNLPQRETIEQALAQAYDHILLAETSCNFYWGSQWINKSFDVLEVAYRLLDAAAAQLPPAANAVGTAAQPKESEHES